MPACCQLLQQPLIVQSRQTSPHRRVTTTFAEVVLYAQMNSVSVSRGLGEKYSLHHRYELAERRVYCEGR
jgi:hypothetical protein